MKLSFAIAVCILLECLSRPPAITQVDFSQDWRWIHFTVESGLPGDRVQEVYEASDSTVWVGTALGLAWFDGYQWVPMDTTQGLPTNFPANIIGEIDDSLVVSTGRQYYIGTKKGFHHLDIPIALAAAAVDRNRLLFVKDANLYQYRHGVISLFQPQLRQTQGRTMTLVRGRFGAVWIHLIDGLYKWEDGELRLKIKAGSSPLAKSVIVENREGDGVCSVVFPFERRGLWEWSRRSAPVQNKSEKADNVTTMDISAQGEVIAVYPSDQVRVRVGGVWMPISFNHSQLRDINTVAFRRNGDLWVGTQHGLFLYRRSSSRWTYWNHPPPDLRNSVNEILRTRSGDMWMGTSDGIEIRHPSGQTEQVSTINGVPLYIVTGLAEDGDGNIWVSSGASFYGAFRWDGKKWEHFSVGEDSSQIRFHKIRTDRHGRAWFLGIGKFFPPLEEVQPGAFVLDHGRFQHWGEKEGLLNGRVYTFGEGADGTLWFGTYAGLSRYKSGTWTHWSTRHGLHAGRVFTLAIDNQDKPWFGDYSDKSGMATIDDNDSIRYFGMEEGLVSDNVWDIKFDDEGTMWVATARGLSSYAHGVWSTYDEKSGLQHVSLWPVLPFGDKVYVGTTGQGIAIFHKEESKTLNPRISLERPLTEGNNVILRWKAFAYWGELFPDEILTRVRINNGDWTRWQRSSEITLPDQKAGAYDYEVQAKGVFGNFSKEGARGSFSVPLPLHLRPLFLFPVGALGLTVIWLGTVLLVRKRRHDIALRKSEAKFRAVAEMTLSAIFIYQGERVLFVNPGAEKLTGYSESELSTMKLWEIVHPDHRQMIREWETARHGDSTVPHRAEFKIITKRGEERWMNFTWGWIKFQDSPATLASAFDITEQKLAEQKLRSLASELSATEERERRRLATYLHDTIGQTLAFCKMKIRLLQRSQPRDAIDGQIQEIRELVEQSITDTRSLTYELSPPVLYELSFVAALEWLTNELSTRYKMKISLEDDKEPKEFSDELRVFLFHAVKEVLVNAAKHAEAKNVNVFLRTNGRNVHIFVEDAG